MSWSQMYSGSYVWPLQPNKTPNKNILLKDIAHSLSHQCRYNGHCRKQYTVAEHSVYVAKEVMKRTSSVVATIMALFHDATETFIGDIPSPIKRQIPGIKEIEDAWHEKIVEALQLPDDKTYCQIIKEVDLALLMTEAKQLMVWPPPMDWGINVPSLDIEIQCLAPTEAEEFFLTFLKSLDLGLYERLIAQDI